MAKDARRWTLEDLVDFENEISAGRATPPDLREAVVAAAGGLDGAAARRAGLKVWLDGARSSGAGGKFTAALGTVAAGLGALMFLAGLSGALGMLDREKDGVHVTLFLAVLIGGQWLVLLLAMLAWLTRRRAAMGFSLAQALIGKLARRFADAGDAPWWGRMTAEGGALRTAMLWRFARTAQTAGISFNLGILAGLSGLVLLRHVGFFWETTTEVAMNALLEKLARILSAPWSAWWPAAVPDAAVIDASRWLPGESLRPGPAAWWKFLLMATLCWGLLPRLVLWLAAWRAERSALGKLDFQARAHRALWRDLTGHGRGESSAKPLDGVLVLDVGGSGLDAASMRPFLLRHMRVHPAAWLPVAVLDPGAEEVAAKALAAAPAGVVLLAEGWALSPARMGALHAGIRAAAGCGVPLRFLVANCAADHTPLPPADDERREWERFTDSLRDPELEVVFYEAPQPAV